MKVTSIMRFWTRYYRESGLAAHRSTLENQKCFYPEAMWIDEERVFQIKGSLSEGAPHNSNGSASQWDLYALGKVGSSESLREERGLWEGKGNATRNRYVEIRSWKCLATKEMSDHFSLWWQSIEVFLLVSVWQEMDDIMKCMVMNVWKSQSWTCHSGEWFQLGWVVVREINEKNVI